jgi:hypothetical protein
MPSESIHVFIKVSLDTFPENKKPEINIIKEFIDLYYQVFGCSCEDWHLLIILGYYNKYKEKDINGKKSAGTTAQRHNIITP